MPRSGVSRQSKYTSSIIATNKLHREWFKLRESFPKGNLLVRNDYGDPLRTIYLTNEIVKVRHMTLTNRSTS